MSVTVIIPARGGSKGVAGKNLRRVGGIPLVTRAIMAAKATGVVDAIIVSTDDSGIAATARAAGASVVDRPRTIAGDTATSESALLHVLGTLNSPPDVTVFVQATSPFIDPGDLARAIERVRAGHDDVVFSAVENYGFLWRATDTGATGVNHDSTYRPRRQDREAHYLETGAFYVMRTAGFVEAGHRFFGRIGFTLVDPRTAVEIDTIDELEVACALAPVLDAESYSHHVDVDAVVTDFDGVHTDDRVLVSAGGAEFVTTSRSDGMGVRLLREADIPVLILSTEVNRVVSARAAKLKVDVRQGVADKAGLLAEWAAARGIPLDRIAYLGNDVNDLGCMAIVGWPVAVPGSVPEVIAAARLVLDTPGGYGAVRELADLVLKSRTPQSQEESWPLHLVAR